MYPIKITLKVLPSICLSKSLAPRHSLVCTCLYHHLSLGQVLSPCQVFAVCPRTTGVTQPVLVGPMAQLLPRKGHHVGVVCQTERVMFTVIIIWSEWLLSTPACGFKLLSLLLLIDWLIIIIYYSVKFSTEYVKAVIWFDEFNKCVRVCVCRYWPWLICICARMNMWSWCVNVTFYLFCE